MSSVGVKASELYAVVYQFGKVASTSIVNSLNAVPGVTAVQSHFLGTENLKQMVDMFVDVERPLHFYEHNLGQFLKNLQITRNIYEFRAQRRPGEKLVVISLCRDPLDWLRSSIAQDIVGYLPFFKAVAKDRMLDLEDEDAIIEAVLPLILSDLQDGIARVGGIDEFMESGKPWNQAFPHTGNPPLVRDYRRFFALMLRPFEWYEEHFERLLEMNLSVFRPIAPRLLHHDATWCEVFVLRYEDIPVSMPVIANKLGIAGQFRLSQDNVSASKNYAAAIRKGFASEEAVLLSKAFQQTRYSRLFGYAPEDTAEAAPAT